MLSNAWFLADVGKGETLGIFESSELGRSQLSLDGLSRFLGDICWHLMLMFKGVCVCIFTHALYSGTNCKAQNVVVAFPLKGIGDILSSWAQLSLTVSSSLLWTEVTRKWVVQGCRLQEPRHKPHDSNTHFSSKGLWMSSSLMEN